MMNTAVSQPCLSFSSSNTRTQGVKGPLPKAYLVAPKSCSKESYNSNQCFEVRDSQFVSSFVNDRTVNQNSRTGTNTRASRLVVRASGANSFGRFFRVTTFGESHGGGVGCVIDGIPPRMPLTQEEIQFELDRRRPGQSRITTPRNEFDTCEILSGLVDDITLGTPLAVLVRNKDQRSKDYSEMNVAYRPSHADATYDYKYGVRAIAGGGRSSARETIGRVAAGAVAKKILKLSAGVEVLAFVSAVRDVKAENVDLERFTMEDIESNIVRCPDQESAEKMIAAIDEVRVRGDSCGGQVSCVVRGCPKGLGAPVFAKLEADLAAAMLSIPATKGFSIGSGFEGSTMLGSTHNDEFYSDESGEIRTRTNRSGGIQGGISNGESIVISVAFKPTSTISRAQNTVRRDGQEEELRARGRHDPCVVPRAVPMVEAMVALVLVDHLLAQQAQCHLFGGAFTGGDLSSILPPLADTHLVSEVASDGLSVAAQAEAFSED
mmetsp:Transcript_39188/g.54406  ORF Transcript_39188/g.54406 Transcript_39188/m.54406 type:complete len:492 (-) Transcript_39188:163-1638(-)|eukprot:CAMPEP_0196592026 /NCGR_PEP_ID=MMETSP1081-20130531/71627_1 /TAXON_ID=36882 /ORGANISM="Pyramimonas amylifera, Strain CCMP720" /LENGTH=491 /DNA_ID=CAMNT_0041915583 /DNA_START=151 /DNA_END=1626 /DNA_ORIENTATION=-